MSKMLAISPHIVESLYREALALSDDVRATFALSGQLARSAKDTRKANPQASEQERARIAYSNAGLRTTTRMMHAIAWLLNHRAYFMGEINAIQLRRHGRLDRELLTVKLRDEALLGIEVLHLIERTGLFYERLVRLDEHWRLSQETGLPPSAIQRLRQRIESRLAS